MDLLNKEKVASVVLLEVKVSEDELALYEAALSYVLDSLNKEQVELRLGATIDEIEAVRDELRARLEKHGGIAVSPSLASIEE
jgi:hypothetical protein